MSFTPTILALVFVSGCSAWGTAPAATSATHLDSKTKETFEAAKHSHTDAVKKAEESLAGLHKKVVSLDKFARNDTMKLHMAEHAVKQAGANAERRTVLKSVRSAAAKVKSQLRGMEKSTKLQLREVQKTALNLKKQAKANFVDAKTTNKFFEQAEDKVEDMRDRVERQKEDGEQSAERISEDVEALVERAYEKRERAQEAKEEAKERAQEEKERAERRQKEEKERAAEKQRRQEKEAAKKKAKEAKEAKTVTAAPAAEQNLAADGGAQTLAAEPASFAMRPVLQLCAVVAMVSLALGLVVRFRSSRQVVITESPLLG